MVSESLARERVMLQDGSVTQWIAQAKAGDERAIERLWELYFPRLVALCRKRLADRPRLASDEEDAALSAFASFCRRAREGRFPRLQDRDDLWHLLVVIAVRKVVDHVQWEQRKKRGGGAVLGESAIKQAEGFLDSFASAGTDTGVFAVCWPAEVRVLELRGLRQALPEAPSPLQTGDSLYALGEFSEALAAYQEQGRSFGSGEIGQQVRYKEALCLLGLQRGKEAEVVLERLASEPGERWPALAACRLWLDRIRQKRFDQTEELFRTLSARYRPEQLMSFVPSEMYREIVIGYATESGQINVYKINAGMLSQCRRAVFIAQLFGVNDVAISAKRRLVRAYWLIGQEDQALRLAEELARAPWDQQGWYLTDCSWLLRLAGRPEQALAEWIDAKEKRRTAPVTTGRDGSNRIVITAKTYTAKYRNGKNHVGEVATRCRTEDAARAVLADLEKRADKVRSGIRTAAEDAVIDHQATPLAEHVAAYFDRQNAKGITQQQTVRFDPEAVQGRKRSRGDSTGPEGQSCLRLPAVPQSLSPETPLFTVPAGLVRILDRDLRLAGIPKRDERGRTIDVHALRHTFGTLLSKGGVTPRTAQAAMRHSTINLTMNVYTDPKLLDVAGGSGDAALTTARPGRWAI
jgi:integrase/DNA-directed RNA polymerase specialized sigma24 family protein